MLSRFTRYADVDIHTETHMLVCVCVLMHANCFLGVSTHAIFLDWGMNLGKDMTSSRPCTVPFFS